MSKKPSRRQPHHPSHPIPEVDPDDVEMELEEEKDEGVETMPEEKPIDHGSVHQPPPDPKGKMTSYAPGYGPEGELPKKDEEKKDE